MRLAMALQLFAVPMEAKVIEWYGVDHPSVYSDTCMHCLCRNGFQYKQNPNCPPAYTSSFLQAPVNARHYLHKPEDEIFPAESANNEDRELSDIIIDYTAAYTAYQASLQAAGMLNQTTLLNYI